MDILVENLYYIVLLIGVLSAIYSFKKDSKALFGFSLFLMLLIASIRFGQGIDYFSYEYLYRNQLVDSFGTMLDHQVRFEVGFRTLIFIFKSLGLSAHVFIATCSIFTMTLFSIWIYKNSAYKTFSLVVFYGMFYLIWVVSALRQGLVMSVATYLFFSKDKKLKIWQECVVILMLSTIHYSAVIYFVFLLVREIKISNRILILLLLISIVVTYLPIPKILSYFTFFPGVNKLISGSISAPGIFNFPGIVRLLFSGYFIFLLCSYEWNEYERTTIQLSLFGMIFYFALKMNELWAGRVAVFTFVFVPIIFSFHIRKLERDRIYKYGMILASLIFTVFYFQKDANATQILTGSLNQSRFIKLNTISNVTYRDYWNYENENAIYTYFKEKMNSDKETFIDQHDILYEAFDENVNVVSVFSPITGNYGIINERGYWITDQNYGIRPVVRNRVVQRYMSGGLRSFEYEDRYNLGLSDLEIREDVNKSIIKDQENLEQIPSVVELQVEDIKEELLKVFPSIKPISGISMMNFQKPFEYNIVQVRYHNYVFFLYFNEDLELMRDNVYLDLNRFNADGFLFAKGLSGVEVINKEGIVIMYE